MRQSTIDFILSVTSKSRSEDEKDESRRHPAPMDESDPTPGALPTDVNDLVNKAKFVYSKHFGVDPSVIGHAYKPLGEAKHIWSILPGTGQAKHPKVTVKTVAGEHSIHVKTNVDAKSKAPMIKKSCKCKSKPLAHMKGLFKDWQSDYSTYKKNLKRSGKPKASGYTPVYSDKLAAKMAMASGFLTPNDKHRAEYILEELDAEKAPDIKYRDAFSSGSKIPLKRGETWRGRLVTWVKKIQKDRENHTKASVETTAAPPKHGDISETVRIVFRSAGTPIGTKDGVEVRQATGGGYTVHVNTKHTEISYRKLLRLRAYLTHRFKARNLTIAPASVAGKPFLQYAFLIKEIKKDADGESKLEKKKVKKLTKKDKRAAHKTKTRVRKAGNKVLSGIDPGAIHARIVAYTKSKNNE